MSCCSSFPFLIILLPTGNVYIADEGNNRIRKVTVSTGLITTIAGTGTGGYSGDNGAATSAKLNSPYDITVDSSGKQSYFLVLHYILLFSYLFLLANDDLQDNIYIADGYNNRIRKVTVLTGLITTIAGSSTSGSYSGDGGAATSAGLNHPVRVTTDTSGS